jgi:molybdenum cofactor cytidylyltransferase
MLGAMSPTHLLLSPPTVLVLASGRGERFAASGGRVHKLQALLGHKTVLEHTLDAVRSSGLPWHLEDIGHPGMGDSIAAAVRATANADGWLVLPGDLPLIQAATLRQVAQALQDHPVVVPVFQTQGGPRGHPVGFARSCGEALLALKGNQGAAPVLRSFVATEFIVDDPGTVTDIDTLQDLERASALWAARQS